MTKQEVYTLTKSRKLSWSFYKIVPEIGLVQFQEEFKSFFKDSLAFLVEEAKSCGFSNEVVESLNETYTCISTGIVTEKIYSIAYINKVARLFSKSVKLMQNEIEV